MPSKDISRADLLDTFLVKELNPEVLCKDHYSLSTVLWIVYRFVKMENLMSAMPSPKLIRGLKKMTEYARAVETICNTGHSYKRQQNHQFRYCKSVPRK